MWKSFPQIQILLKTCGKVFTFFALTLILRARIEVLMDTCEWGSISMLFRIFTLWLWLFILFVTRNGFCESFQWELLQKRQDVLRVIGANRLRLIERVSSGSEIYRITQLLNIDGVGDNTVLSLGLILGYRFHYEPNIEECSKNKDC